MPSLRSRCNVPRLPPLKRYRRMNANNRERSRARSSKNSSMSRRLIFSGCLLIAVILLLHKLSSASPRRVHVPLHLHNPLCISGLKGEGSGLRRHAREPELASWRLFRRSWHCYTVRHYTLLFTKDRACKNKKRKTKIKYPPPHTRRTTNISHVRVPVSGLWSTWHSRMERRNICGRNGGACGIFLVKG